MATVTFTLTDAEGEDHQYEVTPHSGRQGQQIFWRLTALGVEPMAAALGAFDFATALQEGVADLNSKVDLDAVAGQLRQSILAQDPSELAEDLLQFTLRDGKPLKGIAFDKAYQGNWMEYAQALFHVIRANRFFPLPTTS